MVTGEDHPLVLPAAQQLSHELLHAPEVAQQQCYTTPSGGGAGMHTGCAPIGAEAAAHGSSEHAALPTLPTSLAVEPNASSRIVPPSGGFGAVRPGGPVVM